eukprot:5714612-Lingulodinium_polyedra.AAC.1
MRAACTAQPLAAHRMSSPRWRAVALTGGGSCKCWSALRSTLRPPGELAMATVLVGWSRMPARPW